MSDEKPKLSEWRLIEDGPGDAAWNMAVDEAIAESCRRELSPPTIRFYGWTQAALTIGYFQKAERDLDQAVCRKEGIPIIRRITGGRAVLHGNDLTYSIASGTHAVELPDTIRGSFLAISRGFIEGLRRLGVEADAVRAPAKETGRSPLCFMSASWYEITCRGRKIIGSAQRRWKDGMLQQGSLLLGFNPEDHEKYFRSPDDNGRKHTVQNSRNRIFGLHDLVPERMTSQKIAKQIAAGFETSLGIRLEPGQLSPFELEQADFLARTRYRTDSWNAHRSF